MTADPRASDLYRRYMAADTAYREHAATCTACTRTEPSPGCRNGVRLHGSFSDLQAAYLNAL
ncbi:hypothetical protein [Streptomyces sp. NPDC088752]|uniref:hypothetical protein n=1 Tax=Streptomyces sp. NPDC088752 TaxID=3154963 RepID=UPI00344856C7